MEITLLLIVILLLVIFNSGLRSRVRELNERIAHIENYLKQISKGTPPAVKEPAAIIKTETTATVKTVETPPPVKQTPPVEPPVVENPVFPPVTPDKPVVLHETIKEPIKVNIPVAEPVKPAQPLVPKEGWYERFRKNNPDLEKFIGENLASKIGIAILVLGIAYFVKFAIDKNWINEVARTGIGILSGAIVMGFAHKLHKTYKAFSSVLVAGAISIFYFTIGIAFHQYHLFSQPVAFAIMLIITVFSVFLSVIYDRVELAALSITGGFAVPFMLSTGQGNYKVLFVYILILDLGMLVLAYLRKWNLINILAYVFTVVLYVLWVEGKVIGAENAPYRGALFFGALFYLVFIIMNIINNVKEKRPFGAIELSILISNTFIFYGVGMQLLKAYHPEWQGIFSVALAGFNFICAFLLYKRFKADTRLVYLMIGLTLTFITLAAPVQLKGNYITLFWAAEAVVLLWLAQRSGIAVFRFASVLISGLTLISLFMDWSQLYSAGYDLKLPVIINKACTSGLATVISLFSLAYLAGKEKESVRYLGMVYTPLTYKKVVVPAAIGVLYLTGLFETMYQFNYYLDYFASQVIVFGAYHLVFFALLTFISHFRKTNETNGVLLIINSINLFVFVLLFSLLPIEDLKYNVFTMNALYGIPGSQIGFVAHYLSLIASVYLGIWLFKQIKASGKAKVHTVYISLVAVGLLVVSSGELLLHVLKFSVNGLTSIGESVSVAEENVSSVSRHVVKIGFPILWGLLAFVYLFTGMKKRFKPLRVAALILLGVTLLKLFLFDINTTSQAGKIIAFICLGVLLLIISFMYQKIKALIKDDEAAVQQHEPKTEDKI